MVVADSRMVVAGSRMVVADARMVVADSTGIVCFCGHLQMDATAVTQDYIYLICLIDLWMKSPAISQQSAVLCVE